MDLLVWENVVNEFATPRIQFGASLGDRAPGADLGGGSKTLSSNENFTCSTGEGLQANSHAACAMSRSWDTGMLWKYGFCINYWRCCMKMLVKMWSWLLLLLGGGRSCASMNDINQNCLHAFSIISANTPWIVLDSSGHLSLRLNLTTTLSRRPLATMLMMT